MKRSLLSGLVEVSNGTTQIQQIAAYPAAEEILDGGFTGAEGHTQNELSRWVSVSPQEAELAAGRRCRATAVTTSALRPCLGQGTDR